MLVSTQIRVTRKGGKMHLVIMETKIRELIEISRLDEFFKIYESMDVAKETLA